MRLSKAGGSPVKSVRVLGISERGWPSINSSKEFCDLYTVDKDICHVKKYGQSGVLSHLFAQGVVSGELFRSDIKFRQKVNQKLPAPYPRPVSFHPQTTRGQ